eukprot:664807-Amphidinium_carterae.1
MKTVSTRSDVIATFTFEPEPDVMSFVVLPWRAFKNNFNIGDCSFLESIDHSERSGGCILREVHTAYQYRSGRNK